MRVNTRIKAVLFTTASALVGACGGGGGNNNSSSSPSPADTTPDAFTFTDQTGVTPSSVVTSAAVTISGIDAASAISVTGGEYSIGCSATYGAAAGEINPGQQVCVRHTSAATGDTSTDTTLTVGGVSDTFTSTTGVVALEID